MKFPASRLSGHACLRLSEHFKIVANELLRLLNSGLGKVIGFSEETHLVHRLVWSHLDGAFLVAIQDVTDGTVLTVLPVDMYRERYGENLTDKRLHHVINQMVHAGYAPPSLWVKASKRAVSATSSLVELAIIWSAKSMYCLKSFMSAMLRTSIKSDSGG